MRWKAEIPARRNKPHSARRRFEKPSKARLPGAEASTGHRGFQARLRLGCCGCCLKLRCPYPTPPRSFPNLHSCQASELRITAGCAGRPRTSMRVTFFARLSLACSSPFLPSAHTPCVDPSYMKNDRTTLPPAVGNLMPITSAHSKLWLNFRCAPEVH